MEFLQDFTDKFNSFVNPSENSSRDVDVDAELDTSSISSNELLFTISGKKYVLFKDFNTSGIVNVEVDTYQDDMYAEPFLTPEAILNLLKTFKKEIDPIADNQSLASLETRFLDTIFKVKNLEDGKYYFMKLTTFTKEYDEVLVKQVSTNASANASTEVESRVDSLENARIQHLTGLKQISKINPIVNEALNNKSACIKIIHRIVNNSEYSRYATLYDCSADFIESNLLSAYIQTNESQGTANLEYCGNYYTVLKNIRDSIDYLHSNSVSNFKITTNNIVVNNNGDILFIDLHNIFIKNNIYKSLKEREQKAYFNRLACTQITDYDFYESPYIENIGSTESTCNPENAYYYGILNDNWGYGNILHLMVFKELYLAECILNHLNIDKLNILRQMFEGNTNLMENMYYYDMFMMLCMQKDLDVYYNTESGDYKMYNKVGVYKAKTAYIAIVNSIIEDYEGVDAEDVDAIYENLFEGVDSKDVYGAVKDAFSDLILT